MVERHISVYDSADYHVVFLRMADLDRDQVVAFARHCRDQEYGYLTVASLTLSLVTGSRLSFGVDGQEIYSGLGRPRAGARGRDLRGGALARDAGRARQVLRDSSSARRRARRARRKVTRRAAARGVAVRPGVLATPTGAW